MRQEIALKQLRLRGGAADPSLRYQLNAQVQGTRFLDRERGGCFLRAKYRDVGALVTEQRKGLQEEGTFRQVDINMLLYICLTCCSAVHSVC